MKNSMKELKERILHNSLCFFTLFQGKKEQQLKLTRQSSKVKSRLRKGVLKHLVRKSIEEIEEKMEQRKSELSPENSALTTGENEVDNQLSQNYDPSNLNIRVKVDSTKKYKNRIFSLLVSMGKIVIPSSKAYAKSKDVDTLRSQIQALNKSLQKQEEEKLEMRQELNNAREQVLALMQHLAFVGSSFPPSSSLQCNNKDDNEDCGNSYIK
ncbi:hypothetical protein VNO78_19927 [Psophocarpus tetragonolobus]|uniref:Uncharacterized protein n=1 Tax=Psophocarpus tetragonolobus TaxID=3891 RepID=A0AAN9S8Z7_PSOTE